jgi:hypothetical protein
LSYLKRRKSLVLRKEYIKFKSIYLSRKKDLERLVENSLLIYRYFTNKEMAILLDLTENYDDEFLTKFPEFKNEEIRIRIANILYSKNRDNEIKLNDDLMIANIYFLSQRINNEKDKNLRNFLIKEKYKLMFENKTCEKIFLMVLIYQPIQEYLKKKEMIIIVMLLIYVLRN